MHGEMFLNIQWLIGAITQKWVESTTWKSKSNVLSLLATLLTTTTTLKSLANSITMFRFYQWFSLRIFKKISNTVYIV